MGPASRNCKGANRLLVAILLFAVSVTVGAFGTVALASARDAEQAFRQKDYPRVLESCARLADDGDRVCQFFMGMLYKYGWGVNRDLGIAVDWLKKSSDQDLSHAQEALGDCYLHGLGVTKDYSEALRLFRLAEKKGNLWAIYQIGLMYRNGQQVQRDLVEALRYIQSAANKGNPGAQAALADMYRLGEGVEALPDEAFQWATKSAKQGWHAGQNILALLFRDGVGVRQDSAQAIELFKLAASSGRAPVAFCNLGQLYRYGAPDMQPNLTEAMRWIEQGVRAKNLCSISVASAILGRGGKGVDANPQRAFALASEGASSNHAPSINVLGWFYRDGIGTEPNTIKAIENFQRAAALKNGDAMANLCRAFAVGNGVEKDILRAKTYCEQALAAPISPGGRKGAQDFLANLSITGNSQVDAKAPQNNQAAETVRVQQALIQENRTGDQQSQQSLQSQQADLIARLDKMQQQLAALQASANTASVSTALGKPQIVYATRRALVIGNDSYKHVSPLENAGADAKAIAQTLEGVGYQVTLRQDLDEKAFKQTLRDFRLQVQGGDEVLVYFAGHGVQVGSANFLLPVDIKGDNEEQVKDEGIELQRVLDLLRERKAKFSLAIVDACRDNPFKQSGRAIGGRGLAPTTAATGQMVMFSAGAGEQALDRLGPADQEKNGLFTRVLLREMIKPGVPVDRVLRNVRAEVVKLASSVGREQTPALYDQAVGDFYFKR